ncbi:MAG: helix-turn-helix transcriptional regulator [Acidobacteriaceae bacterium]|nr:helix-turn-helix transcriptional regulator [Acidobacteriaceae bacterium]
MQNRSLKLRLAEILKAKRPNDKLTMVAEDLGISDTTLRKYLRNEALTFERRVLERLCDYLDVGIEDLIELVPCDFFPPSKRVTVLRNRRGSPDDYEMLGKLEHLFSQNNIGIEEETCDGPNDIAACIKAQDCLIVGSPRNNAAGAIAMCTLFQAGYSDPSRENRRKLPFVMHVPHEWHETTAVMQNPARDRQNPAQCQLVIATSADNLSDKETTIAADYFPQDKFESEEITDGKDLGFVFVADHSSSTDGTRRRTYWVSGFTSIGTLASTRVIESELRSFSIDKPGGYVLAVIQARFSKPTQSRRRNLEDYHVVHTLRGTLPLVAQVVEEEDLEDTFHNARMQKLRARIEKSWRPMRPEEKPLLEQFYDRELRGLSNTSFGGILKSLPTYATIPANRRSEPFTQYLQKLRDLRDKGESGLFPGE